MQAWIMSVGSELLLGALVDTNSAWLSQRLAEIGIAVVRHVTVGDDLQAICEAIQEATQRAKLVLISGGLGPTEDDRTRQALAAAMQVPLELHEPSLRAVQAFFKRRGRIMPEVNQIQAMFPQGSEPIENTCGTAPGVAASVAQAKVFVMPGVPAEMKTMFDRSVLPRLRAEGTAAVLLTETLHCFGLGESSIGERIRDLMQPRQPVAVGTAVSGGVITIRITARERPDQARQMVEQTAREVRARLGELVFGQGQDTLATAAARLLVAHGKTVATAESCTGGLVAKYLTDVPGSSGYFLGSIVAYANEAKSGLLGVDAGRMASRGAVSEEVAEAMAVACREKLGSDLAVGITGIAGPTGATLDKPVGLVYVALVDAAGCEVAEHRFTQQDRWAVRERAALTALNMIRLRLLR
jgi:nicotinamide-nucleotide amidase